MLFNLVSHMSIPSPLCNINRWHWMSLVSQPRRSGTHGLSEALLQWTRGLSTCDFICICICGLPVTTRGCEWVVTTICGLWSLFASMCCRYIYMNCLWCLLWTICDVYLNVVVVVTEPNKLIICGIFAECNTRERGFLPSASCKPLGKVDTWQNSVHPGTKMASLPSVCPMTLGKEAKFYGFWNGLCRVPILWHTAKRSHFAECPLFDMAKRPALPSIHTLTHGKKASFAECSEFDTRQMGQICRGPKVWHTANNQALPSA